MTNDYFIFVFHRNEVGCLFRLLPVFVVLLLGQLVIGIHESQANDENVSTVARDPEPIAADPDSILEEEEEDLSEGIVLPDIEDEEPAKPSEAIEQERIRTEQYHLHMEEGRRYDSLRNWREAISSYTAALRQRKNDPAALRARGRAYVRKTPAGECPRLGIEDMMVLRSVDRRGLWEYVRGNVLKWMGHCGDEYSEKRYSLARELAQLSPRRRGRPARAAATYAQLLRDKANSTKNKKIAKTLIGRAQRYLQKYRRECDKANRDPGAEALELEAALFLRTGDLAKALAVDRLFLELYSDHPSALKVHKRIADTRLQLEIEQFPKQGRPTLKAQQAFDKGRKFLRSGNLQQAKVHLNEAVEEFPRFARAYKLLGQVLARDTSTFAKAIDAFKKATILEPNDYEAHSLLGLLYMKEYPGEEELARRELEAALMVRPDLIDYNYYLGKLWARDDKQKSREYFLKFIEQSSHEHVFMEDARSQLQALSHRVNDTEITLAPLSKMDALLLEPELQELIAKAHVLGVGQGRWQLAEAELIEQEKRFANDPAYHNTLATVVYAQDRLQEARKHWENSLALDDQQMEVHERLGVMVDDMSQRENHLRTAARLGSITARYLVAEQLWNRFSLLESDKQLDDYFSEAGPYDLSWDRAVNLRERIDQLFFKVYLAAALVGLTITSIPVLWFYRRTRGASLEQLLDRAPKSFPDVARIISLIRHEILKHNTAFLVDVGNAVEWGEEDADLRAQVLSRRLFGKDVPDESVPGRMFKEKRGEARERRGIYGRFLGYVIELEKVGLTQGVRLNLQRKDPIFRSMIVAFDKVAKKQRDLLNLDRLSVRKQAELARLLQHSGQILGRQGFEELTGILQSICVSNVNPQFVRSVYDQVIVEDQFIGAIFQPLPIVGFGAPIRIFPTDLEDILANVLRNSLRSSLRYADPPVGLGVDLIREHDEVTGLTSLAVRVKDNSRERLTSEMLRGRYVERGMGITADLLSRYDASIACEFEPGWQKSVVLRFFTMESSEFA